MDKHTGIGVGSLLFTSFLYGFYGILARIVSFNIPLFYGCFLRNIFGTLVLFLFVFKLKKWKKIKKQDYIWIILRSLFGILGFLGSYIPLLYIPIGTFYFVCYAGCAIGGYTIGTLLHKEKLTKATVVSLFLAIMGLGLIYSFSGIDISKIGYLVLSFFAGIGTAVWNTFSKKVSNTYSALQLNFLDFAFFAVVDFMLSLILREVWVMPQMNIVWGATVAFTVMFIITGQLTVYGYRYLSAHVGTLISLSEILFGILFGYLFYRETISQFAVIGGVMIITAMVLPGFVDARKKVISS